MSGQVLAFEKLKKRSSVNEGETPSDEFEWDGGDGGPGGEDLDITHIVFAAYLAGLIDADGTIVRTTTPKPKKKGKDLTVSNHNRVSLTMCDLDILQNVQHMTGVGHIYIEKKPGQNGATKVSYRWAVSKREDVRKILESIAPFLGIRKGAKALEMLRLLDHQEAWQRIRVDKEKKAKNA